MMNISHLIDYLATIDVDTDVYKPAVLLYLLENGGRGARTDLVQTIMRYDDLMTAYYDRLLRRVIEEDLMEQVFFSYDETNANYFLNISLQDAHLVEKAARMCREKIDTWLENEQYHQVDAASTHMPSHKLVRDRVPEIIAADGREPVVETLSGNALQARLLEKLNEEHAELLLATNLEEIADMVEVLLALAKTLDYTEEEVMAFVQHKRAERGGFSKGYFLRAIRTQPADA